jgi:DNA-binding transcriptional LysR family regulator
LDFRQLEAFVTVVSTGSMTVAARVLGTSQPTVSRLVQDLESSVGFQLLTRNGPKIIPTHDGLDFYSEAEGLLNAVVRLEHRARDIATSAPRSFNIASISSVGVAFVPKILARMPAEQTPGKIGLSLQRAEIVPQMVVNGQADLGFANPPLDHPGLEIIGSFAAPCVAALPDKDMLASKKLLKIDDFRGRRFATLGDRFRFRRMVDDALAERGIHIEQEISCSSTIAALHCIQSGSAVGIVDPLTAFSVPLDKVVIRPLAEEILFSWSVIVAEGHPQLSVLRDLVSLHEEVVGEAVPGFRRLDKSKSKKADNRKR